MSELLDLTVKTLSDKLAKDIVTVDMRAVSPYTDAFVIATAANVRQANALADYVQDAAEKQGYEVKSREGTSGSTWVLLDLGEVVVHIFTEETRKQYRLEELWADQPQQRYES
ncbi:ribosome silencing factor [Stecheria sp. CLA-KB-P133]|jgi:ribosome-associated protein|uniref:Ribosomal silencing factor RsfS n=1 Tax=Grylomicrobium aquisgranensis TaxID=2926318 RepID=A0AB35TZF3_9FIRM|nr:ribosome silencing factor [Lactimicrobium massiliense]MDX8418673.1 ribosome silencing factor [Stecheria sp. CLA-KB-P133]MDY3930756.1 ribosome silencing factor [Erysipelotrichaceae bacterium]MDD6230227.1 ribosome silencing factor [Lactimicrobium massiliense]MDD6457311.1 ribosome silencing factor [Lactimicrobium massiliense]MDD6560238.1 ribosome silencing factor [Lactimicrobium massiliense]